MLDLPRFNVEEENKRLREIEMLEGMCHLKLTYPTWKDPEYMLFTKTMKNKFVEGSPGILEELCDYPSM